MNTLPDNPTAPANENPPAFPIEERTSQGEIYFTHMGMTLRDWFAGQALAGELSSQSRETGEWSKPAYSFLAERSYDIADAMLRERAKRATK